MVFHLIFVYTYLLYGILLIITNKEVPILYLFLLLFCCFKVITNYRVCSVAYLECKLRKIKREKSIVNQFLDPIVDLRYTEHIYPLVILSFYILTYNFVYLKRYNDIKKLI
jgi:hypothetical protein